MAECRATHSLNQDMNMPCHFPFVYSGVTYDGCTTAYKGGGGWCAFTATYNGDNNFGWCWGGCVSDEQGTGGKTVSWFQPGCLHSY